MRREQPCLRAVVVLPLLLGAAALAPAASSSSPGSLGDRADALRRKSGDLGARAQAASTDLFAIDARLDRTRASLRDVGRRAAAVRSDQASTRLGLRAAWHAHVVAQRALGARLRALYIEDEPYPLAVVLGARSLDEAMTGLEGMGRAARLDRHVIEQTRRARRKLLGVAARLRARRLELERLAAARAATERALRETRAERAALVSALVAERTSTDEQIATIDARARAAEARASQARHVALAEPVVPADENGPTLPDDGSGAGQPRAAAGVFGGRSLTVTATAYSAEGATASGLSAGYGIVAVDPDLIPIGTRMTIPGYGEAVAGDTGSAVQGAIVDLWFPTERQALAWGRRTITITLH